MLLVLALGLLVGGLSGVLGIGGGVFLIPGLMYLFDYSQKKAQGTTLAAMIPPIGLFAALQYYKQGYVDIRAAVCIAAGFSLGAFITAGYIEQIPTAVLSRLFGCLLLFIGVRFIIQSDRRAAIVFGAGIAFAATWTTFFLLRHVGSRYHVRPYFKDAMRSQATGTPATADYQI